MVNSILPLFAMPSASCFPFVESQKSSTASDGRNPLHETTIFVPTRALESLNEQEGLTTGAGVFVAVFEGVFVGVEVDVRV